MENIYYKRHQSFGIQSPIVGSCIESENISQMPFGSDTKINLFNTKINHELRSFNETQTKYAFVCESENNKEIKVSGNEHVPNLGHLYYNQINLKHEIPRTNFQDQQRYIEKMPIDSSYIIEDIGIDENIDLLQNFHSPNINSNQDESLVEYAENLQMNAALDLSPTVASLNENSQFLSNYLQNEHLQNVTNPHLLNNSQYQVYDSVNDYNRSDRNSHYGQSMVEDHNKYDRLQHYIDNDSQYFHSLNRVNLINKDSSHYLANNNEFRNHSFSKNNDLQNEKNINQNNENLSYKHYLATKTEKLTKHDIIEKQQIYSGENCLDNGQNYYDDPHMFSDNSSGSVSEGPLDLRDCSAVQKTELKRSNRIKRHVIHNPIDNQVTIKPNTKRSYTCKECKTKFTSGNSLKIHQRLHTGERPYKCDQCSKDFLKKSNLIIHQRSHTGEKPHHCTECNKSFRLLSTLKSHILTHTGEQPFKCDQCASSFSQRAALARHKMTHTGDKPFRCDICGSSFQNRDSFKKHSLIHELKAKFTCSTCGLGFKSNKKLETHEMSHNEGDKPFKCSKCLSAAFANPKQLRQHVRRVHETHKRELRCEECDAPFKRLEYLKAHKKVHRGDNIFTCHICKASFNHLATHRKHVKRHAKYEELYQNKNNFVCGICHKCYKTKRQLKAHKCSNSPHDLIEDINT